MIMEAEAKKAGNPELLEEAESTSPWTAVGPGAQPPSAKLDWIEDIPFRSMRGVEIRPPGTLRFYQTLT
jgi:hypothetical protein